MHSKSSNLKINPVKIVVGLMATFVMLIVAFGSFYVVDQGERGVVVRNGAVVKTAEPGLHFKMPLVDNVNSISVRDTTVLFDKKFPLETYTYDQQPATLHLSVTYRVQSGAVERVYTEFGTAEALESRAILRRVPDAVKNVFGLYTAPRAVQERSKLSTDIVTAVRNAHQDLPVDIIGVQVEEIDYGNEYELAVAARMKAEVAIATATQNQKTAQVEADTKVLQAEADAKAVKLRGEAEAAAIQAKTRALAEQGRYLVQLEIAQKWNGVMPTTMPPEAAMTFLGANSK